MSAYFTQRRPGALKIRHACICVADGHRRCARTNGRPRSGGGAGDARFQSQAAFELLDTLDRSWLGTIKDYPPTAWNGVRPDPPKRCILIYHEPGGVIKEHIERWQALARSGADVEILGPCYSGCTLILAYVPSFVAFAKTGKPLLDATLWMLKQYPREIYDWIMERGGVASMTIPTFRELRAPALWSMGYRQCERDQ